MKKRLLGGLIFFLALIGTTQAECFLAGKTCVEGPQTRTIEGVEVFRECWREEFEYQCLTPAADANRCESGTIIKACQTQKSTCTETNDKGTCLETLTPLACEEKLTLPGIRWTDVKDTLTLQTSPEIHWGEACKITASRCRDDAPREISVTNDPERLVTINDVCWEKDITISCPEASEAASCQKLIDLGCTKTQNPVCEKRNDEGVCLTYSQTYSCPTLPTEAPGIVVDEVVTVPGEPTLDESACVKKTQEETDRGLFCEAREKSCLNGTVDACQTWRYTYTCRQAPFAGCQTLEDLNEKKHCQREGSPSCTLKDESGRCVRESWHYRCGKDIDPEAPIKDATLLETIEKPESATPINTCESLQNDASCELTESRCTEPGGTHFVEGEWQTRDCWAFEHTYYCERGQDECASLANNPDCQLVKKICPDDAPQCLRPTHVYRCQSEGPAIAVGEVCDDQVCLEGVCRPQSEAPNRDFAESMVLMELARQAGIYGDVSQNEFFKGIHHFCKDRTGAPSCCRNEVMPSMSNSTFTLLSTFGMMAGYETIKSLGSPFVYDLLASTDATAPILTALYGEAASGAYSPNFSFWGVGYSGGEFTFSPGGFMAAAAIAFYQNYRSCSIEDQQTSMAKGQRLCHFVGTSCEKTSGFSCIKSVEHYVCFNSRLARILNEQGRPQIGRGWGTPRAPIVKGFSQEELASLDFSKMDLSEFLQDIVNEVLEGADTDLDPAVYERAKSRLEKMIKGEISPNAPVEGKTGFVKP